MCKVTTIRSGITTIPLPTQPLYSSMLPTNPAKVEDVLKMEEVLTNAQAIRYYGRLGSNSSINDDKTMMNNMSSIAFSSN